MKSFGAGCVPKLELNHTAIDVDFFGEEIGSDGGFVLERKLLFDVLIQKGCFSDTILGILRKGLWDGLTLRLLILLLLKDISFLNSFFFEYIFFIFFC